MEFKPLIPRDPAPMDARIFRPEPMNLRADLVGIPLDQRFTYDPVQNLFFVNLERFALHSRDDIAAIEKTVETKLGRLGARAYAIVNYDNFTILPELLDEYSAMVRTLVDRFYSGVSRYTTSGFLRMKLGESLEKRGVAPHIFESAAEARKDWREGMG
jgi:propionate CoA-transferase